MTHLPKAAIGTSLFALALLSGTGCSQSADPTLAASTQAGPTEGHIKMIVDPLVQEQPWGKLASQGMIAHPFVFKADKKLKSVDLVGNFNKWDKTANPMKVDADGLTWRLALPLAPGRYVYKFVPFGPEEGTWVVDPNALRDETDKANDNSLLLVVARPFVFKADKKLKSVALVGNFNGWDKTANPMVADADGLTWRLNVPLSSGRYVYKFAPFDPKGEQDWVVDPNAPRDETDKVNANSLLVVKAPGEAAVDAQNDKPTSAPAAHEFVFKADHKIKGVALVGNFNGWNKTASPMVADADGLTWRLAFPLTPGHYVYKFAQFEPDNSEKWVVDPTVPIDPTDKVNDNSLLIVTSTGFEKPGSPTDGVTDAKALIHPHSERDYSFQNGQLALSLRTRLNDLKQVSLKSSGRQVPMKLVRSEGFESVYSAQIPWDRKTDLSYDFELADGSRIETFGANGLSATERPFTISAKNFKPYLLTDAPQTLQMDGPLTTRTVAGPSWAKNQPIYEVNLDLYKFPKGTAIREYEKHLPVLKKMGVGLVWFMPLQPRGYKKGFGSPYAVRDYTAINPDLGTKADFKHLVQTAHTLGLRVLMDWVPNHTSWDNALIDSHPEFYVHDAKGEISQAQTWGDIAQLDYGQAGKWNQPLWNLMRDNMMMWVRECDIDGFRCDVAGSNGRVPAEFWNWLRPQLNSTKPVFMLAEADNAEVHPAFDMTYSWALPPVLWDVCAGRKPASAIDEALRQEARKFPDGAIQMRFLDNHDWHAHDDWGWGNGPAVDTHGGQAVAPLMVLCATLPGKPLLYNGQEMSFQKTDPSADPEASTKSPVWPFYSRLLALYATNPALVEGRFSKIVTDHDDKIYAFTRQRGGNRVLVVVNLGDKPQTATLKNASLAGDYTDSFSNQSVKLSASPSLNLAPWGYRIYVQPQ